jgi:hypothetical protein
MAENEPGAPAPEQNALTPETPAPAPEPTPAPETGETATPDAGEQPERPRKGGRLQERISELTAARRMAEQEAAYWREQAEKAKQSAPQVAAPTLTGDPETDGRALADWQTRIQAAAVEAAKAEVFAALGAGRVEQNTAQQQQAIESEWQERAAEAKSRHTDFEAVALRPDLPVSADMAEFIKTADAGPELLYHLGKNPAEAARIYALPKAQAFREMARLELGLSAPTPRPVSKAPPPPSPVDTGNVLPEKDPAKMSMDEYVRWRTRSRSA